MLADQHRRARKAEVACLPVTQGIDVDQVGAGFVRILSGACGVLGVLEKYSGHRAFLRAPAFMLGDAPDSAQHVGEGFPAWACTGVGGIPVVQLLLLKGTEQQAGQLVYQACDGIDFHRQVNGWLCRRVQREEMLAVDVVHRFGRQRLARQNAGQRLAKGRKRLHVADGNTPAGGDHHRQVRVDIQQRVLLLERRAQGGGGNVPARRAGRQLGEQVVGTGGAIVRVALVSARGLIGHLQLLDGGQTFRGARY